MFWLVMPNLYTQMPWPPPGTPLPAALRALLASRQSVYRWPPATPTSWPGAVAAGRRRRWPWCWGWWWAWADCSWPTRPGCFAARPWCPCRTRACRIVGLREHVSRAMSEPQASNSHRDLRKSQVEPRRPPRSRSSTIRNERRPAGRGRRLHRRGFVLIVILLQAWFYNWQEELAAAKVAADQHPRTPLGQRSWPNSRNRSTAITGSTARRASGRFPSSGRWNWWPQEMAASAAKSEDVKPVTGHDRCKSRSHRLSGR